MQAYSPSPSPEAEAEDDEGQETPPESQETWHINDDGEVELALNDPTESLPTPSGTPAPSSTKEPERSSHIQSTVEHQNTPPTFKQREPTPTLAAYLDHRTSLHLLMYFSHWINTQLEQPENPPFRMTETHARWIFVLLSRIEDFISADDMSLLRNLARSCLAFLKELMRTQTTHADSETPQVTGGEDTGVHKTYMSERSCWFIITAVAGVWGQRDLWMDAEAMLAGLSVL